MRNVFGQIADFFANQLKFIHARVVQEAAVQDFFDQFCLRLNFWDVRNARYGGHFLHKVVFRAGIFLAREIRKLDSVHQRVETHCAGLILVRGDQACKFFFH